MTQEIIENISGVGVLIVGRNDLEKGFLTIKELNTSRKKNKLRGMVSLPMETKEIGESNDQTLERLFIEEVAIGVYMPEKRTKLCICELLPGVVLHAYLFEIDRRSSISLGSFMDEVSSLGWTNFGEIINASKGSLRFRPGVYEVVSSYFTFLKDREKFQPQIYRSNELMHQIPEEAFELAERIVSPSEALSQFSSP